MAVTVADEKGKVRVLWSPNLVRRLRGKRTLAEFGAMLGTSKNTVWRWEAGYSHPDVPYSSRLSGIAERERFLQDWELVGSMKIPGSLEEAKAEISRIFRNSLERTSKEL